MKPKYLILLIFLSVLSCKEEIPTPKQKIFFEKHYLNEAWLPQSSGYLIDSLGNVLEFKWLEVFHQWYDPDSAGYVSSIDMDKNISFCQTINYHINPDTLNFYVNKIYLASKGKISNPEHVMADAGITTYSAFIYDERTIRYKQVLIRTEGDIYINNSTSEAEQLYRWLSGIGK